MDTLQAIVIGFIQGLTEFLPISSSAHLILIPAFTGWPDQGVGFDLSVHVGTLLAVILYFRQDVIRLSIDGTQSLIQRKTVGQSRLAWAVVLATLPAAVAGLLLINAVDTHLRALWIICATTVVFGLLLGVADYLSRKGGREMGSLRWRDVLIIGLAQAMALVPGTSRSGITLTAGLLLGLSRQAAARFSFLLAIPITAMAALAKLVSVAQSDAVVDWGAFLIGGVSAFVTALLAIHFFLQLINRFGLWPYVLYRLALGVVLYWVFLR